MIDSIRSQRMKDARNNGSLSAVDVSLPTRMMLSALAGMGAVNVCHPLDVIRVHMQTSSTTARPLSSWYTAKSIYQQAGLRHGLYAGISAAYVRQILYGSCRMGIYSHLMAQQKEGGAVFFSQKLVLGCIAGSIGSFVGTPAEVALVRMSARNTTSYSSVFDCWKRIVQEEGVRQLWRGVVPTVARATLLSACSLGMTSEVKERLSVSGYFGGEQGPWLDGYPVLFVATTISSFFANLVSTPFDVMKSRLQSNNRYNGVWDCLVKSIRADGISVLWKGFTPAFVKLAPYSIISLTLLDKMTHALTGTDAL